MPNNRLLSDAPTLALRGAAKPKRYKSMARFVGLTNREGRGIFLMSPSDYGLRPIGTRVVFCLWIFNFLALLPLTEGASQRLPSKEVTRA
jgi:hypothetical protein